MKTQTQHKKKKIELCIIPHSGPDYLGGVSLFFNNLTTHIQKEKLPINITWIYFGTKHQTYKKNGITYKEVPHTKAGPLTGFIEKLRFAKILKENNYDILNTGAGIWTLLYKKPKGQKLIHTYHGTIYHFYKNHLQRYSNIKKILFYPYLIIPYYGEKITKKADKIICVSEKVKRNIEELYGKQKNIKVIRTGVKLQEFKTRNKTTTRKKLGLTTKKIYGLYIGRGGTWTKGLDRAINLAEQSYKKNKNYQLIIIGPEEQELKQHYNKPYLLIKKNIPRKEIPLYYNAADTLLCLSRIEGGAPTLTVSEAMASECLVTCAKSAEQEIITHNKNGIILTNFEEQGATTILETLNNKKKKEILTTNAKKTIQKLSLHNWGKKYLKELLN